MTSVSSPMGFNTQRLKMRPICDADKQLYRQLYCDPKVMRNISAPLSQQQADKAFATYLEAMTPYQHQASSQTKYMSWTIVETLSQQPIGIQGLTWHTHDKTIAEIGIMLLPKANGKGYPEEAMGALLEYGFQQLKLSRIYAHFASTNLATKRFVKKLGFIFEPLGQHPPLNKKTSQKCYIELPHYLT
ncbi:GNAT family N-acetyltransferase [Shewanella sp. Isolate11]|uniref:GNAT family N-acetyltransferase n=1 Tax=Shewanella sp. Isolate11 TaxID=2908530 RepID=UPI001EFD9E12|nr:GNAT family N-acetyltransferase [Shewanella sp. Isolate11]MCG9697716.1 GNAT family N-acetyltransferase [Shewanella sp. Isolate11]